GHVLRQHVGHAAAERIIDAAGAAGCDGDGDLLRARVARKPAAEQGSGQGAEDQSFALHVIVLPFASADASVVFVRAFKRSQPAPSAAAAATVVLAGPLRPTPSRKWRCS